MKTKFYLNLTNGIEALPAIVNNGNEWGVIRIQSTACEQKLWEHIIQSIDYDFLFNLAMGTQCVVVDYSNKRNIPRAIWQGLEWITYCLYKAWYGKEYKVCVRANDVTPYYKLQYESLSRSTKNKLKYFRKFLLTDELHIRISCGKTDKDGNHEFYRMVLEDTFKEKES